MIFEWFYHALFSSLDRIRLHSCLSSSLQSHLELEAVTRINTMCNGQQLARFVTKPTADMIAHVQEERAPARITWSGDLETVIREVTTGGREAEEVLYLPPILKRVGFKKF